MKECSKTRLLGAYHHMASAKGRSAKSHQTEPALQPAIASTCFVLCIILPPPRLLDTEQLSSPLLRHVSCRYTGGSSSARACPPAQNPSAPWLLSGRNLRLQAQRRTQTMQSCPLICQSVAPGAAVHQSRNRGGPTWWSCLLIKRPSSNISPTAPHARSAQRQHTLHISQAALAGRTCSPAYRIRRNCQLYRIGAPFAPGLRRTGSSHRGPRKSGKSVTAGRNHTMC